MYLLFVAGSRDISIGFIFFVYMIAYSEFAKFQCFVGLVILACVDVYYV